MEVEALALETRGTKQASAKAVPAAGTKKAAEVAEVLAAGNKPEAAAAEAKSSAGPAKKKMLVQVSDERINFLIANPPDPTFSQRVRAFTEDSDAFDIFDPESRRDILDWLPKCADLVDKWNETRLDILRQFHETGCAYEEIEDDE